MSPWLTIVGIGADGIDGLGERARTAIAAAELVVGGPRHLALIPAVHCPTLAWRSPLVDTLDEIVAWRGRRVVVLATGDPLWYGVGRLLLSRVARDETSILPHVSAFQEACARLGWALEDVTPLSLHARPLDTLRRALQPGRRLILLTGDRDGPPAIAALLRAEGFGSSPMHVLECMGAADERHISATAATLPAGPFSDLNTVALESAGEPGRVVLSTTPGLPDSAFLHDGQITKAEVRAVTLARLAPLPGQLLWDVGAGAGSVAIEWLRAGTAGRAIAVECRADRARRIRANAQLLGTPELEIVEGEAPGCLDGLPCPDAVFVGGGLGRDGLLESCWRHLRPGGRLVANAVTVAGEARLAQLHGAWGGSLTRLAIAHAEPIGGTTAWRPAIPVTQLAVEKPCVAGD